MTTSPFVFVKMGEKILAQTVALVFLSQFGVAIGGSTALTVAWKKNNKNYCHESATVL